MSLPIRVDKCPFCTTYESQRLTARDEERLKTTFWCALKIRKHRWKESTKTNALMNLTICEVRLHYCPWCGKQLIALRHRDSKNGRIEKD